MEWVPLNDYEVGMDIDDRPRKLTKEEIAYITAHLPTAPSADSTAAEVARQGVVEWMISTLQEVSMSPSAIPELIQRIIEQHNKSLVVPGTPVGITAAEAVGATNTQMTLNSVAPWERILIQDVSGDSHLVKIGEWIDSLLLCKPSAIQHIPENRTQYFELEQPVTIASPDKYGKITWEKVTAVTKHLPVGDMVKVTTRSGREVTATQSKSLLVWNGSELIQTEGKNAKVGDLVPIIVKLVDPPIVSTSFQGIELDYYTGAMFGKHLLGIECDEKFLTWIDDEKQLAQGLLHASSKFFDGLCTNIICTDVLDRNHLDHVIRRSESTENSADIMLDPIVSVEFVPATEYVYDLTVPTTTNFSLWNGLGVADTFHSSGSAKSVSFGIHAMKDLIFAGKNPKNESCTIYFANKRATYEEILDSRHYIVGSVVEDFIDANDGVINYDIDSPEALDQYWWHETADILLEKKIPESTKVLRLVLNVVEMFKQNVSIKQLAEVLERDVPPSVTTIYGPISDGIIDIYPHPNIIAETLKGAAKGTIPTELAELTYLESIVLPELKKIRVKGISGIKNLAPVISPVWRIVLHERKLAEGDISNEQAELMLGRYLRDHSGWVLNYNSSIMRTTGLSAENLGALCQLSGMILAGGTTAYLIVSVPNDRFRTSRAEVVIDIGGIKYKQLQNVVKHGDFFYREIDESNMKTTETGWAEELSGSEDAKDKFYDDILPEELWRVNDKFYRIIPNDRFLILNDETYDQIIYRRVRVPDNAPTDPTEYRWTTSDKVYRLISEGEYVQLVNGIQERENYTELTPGRFYEQITDPRIKAKEMKPNEYVLNKVNIDKRARTAEIKRISDARIVEAKELPEVERKAFLNIHINVPRTDLMIASEFIIAETEGSNLKELLALPNIDKTRTTCNNMHTITATLGIEAARTFLIRALHNTISNTGSYVHPANIIFIAEFITSRGEPYGATYTGISRQPGGHLSLATLERAGQVFTKNALHGRKEDIRNVSASVAVGTRMAIGDGAIDIAQNITENGVKKIILNDDLFTALDRDDDTMRIINERGGYLQQGPMTTDDITEGVDQIKELMLGGFDYIGAEDETNLITAFNPGDIISEPTPGHTAQTGTPHTLVRRIQAQPIQARITPKQVVAPHDMVDILAQLKSGVPKDEGQEILNIRPLQTGVIPQPIITEPIISTGLIALPDILPQGGIGIPDNLENLLEEYTFGEGVAPTTVVQELPEADIPQLPDLTGMDLTRTFINLRREQIRDLQPIDTKALNEALIQ